MRRIFVEEQKLINCPKMSKDRSIFMEVTSRTTRLKYFHLYVMNIKVD